MIICLARFFFAQFVKVMAWINMGLNSLFQLSHLQCKLARILQPYCGKVGLRVKENAFSL